MQTASVTLYSAVYYAYTERYPTVIVTQTCFAGLQTSVHIGETAQHLSPTRAALAAARGTHSAGGKAKTTGSRGSSVAFEGTTLGTAAWGKAGKVYRNQGCK